MGEVKHTPLPWRAPGKAGCVYGPDVVVARCGNPGDGEIAPFNIDRWNADAALIVEAVNNHAALRSLVVELVGALGKPTMAAVRHDHSNEACWADCLICDETSQFGDKHDDLCAVTSAETALAAARAQGFKP